MIETCGLPAGRRQERPALPGAHSASNRYSGQEEKDSSFSTSGLTEPTPPVRDYAVAIKAICTDNARRSFLRHADLSPNGYSRPANTKGNLHGGFPFVTHRLDESGRVFLAGCSPAEPVSACSTLSDYQIIQCSLCQRSTGRSSRKWGLCTGA